MDQDRFEELIRSVNAAGTRREAVQRFVGGALASALAVFGLADADADAKERKGNEKGTKGRDKNRSDNDKGHGDKGKNRRKRRDKKERGQPQPSPRVTVVSCPTAKRAICHTGNGKTQCVDDSACNAGDPNGHCSAGGGHANDCVCPGYVCCGGAMATCAFCGADGQDCGRVCVAAGGKCTAGIEGQCCSGKCCNGTCIAANACCTVADCTTPPVCKTATGATCVGGACSYPNAGVGECTVGGVTGCCSGGSCDTTKKVCGTVCIAKDACCSDGDCRQTTDKCKAENGTCTAGVCSYAPIACPAAPVCQTGAGVCNSSTGNCSYDNAPAGACTGAGGAAGCCSGGACDTTKKLCNGACIAKDACCSDSDCTQTENPCKERQGTCTAGTCSFANTGPKACGANNEGCCVVGACDTSQKLCNGVCIADSACCADGDCRQTADKCKQTNGACRRGVCFYEPIACPATPVCQTGAGTCDPNTGTCSYTNAPAGACTVGGVAGCCGDGACDTTKKFCAETGTCIAKDACCTTCGEGQCCERGSCVPCVCQHSNSANPLQGCKDQCTSAGTGCNGKSCEEICRQLCPIGNQHLGPGNPCVCGAACVASNYKCTGSGNRQRIVNRPTC